MNSDRREIFCGQERSKPWSWSLANESGSKVSNMSLKIGPQTTAVATCVCPRFAQGSTHKEEARISRQLLNISYSKFQ